MPVKKTADGSQCTRAKSLVDQAQRTVVGGVSVPKFRDTVWFPYLKGDRGVHTEHGEDDAVADDVQGHVLRPVHRVRLAHVLNTPNTPSGIATWRTDNRVNVDQ